MRKKRFLLGALVIALVFGMTVLGCEEEEEDASITTEVRVIDIPSIMNGENFTMSLIYAGDGRTIATGNGVIVNAPIPGKSNYDGSPVYSYMAMSEFNWKWKGDMTTKPGTGINNERLYISGRINLKIGNKATEVSNSVDILVGSVYGYGAIGSKELKYTDDFN